MRWTRLRQKGQTASRPTEVRKETPPVVFAGFYQEFDALEFEGLRKIEGWP